MKLMPVVTEREDNYTREFAEYLGDQKMFLLVSILY
jgi:hypothetical protein